MGHEPLLPRAQLERVDANIASARAHTAAWRRNLQAMGLTPHPIVVMPRGFAGPAPEIARAALDAARRREERLLELRELYAYGCLTVEELERQVEATLRGELDERSSIGRAFVRIRPPWPTRPAEPTWQER